MKPTSSWESAFLCLDGTGRGVIYNVSHYRSSRRAPCCPTPPNPAHTRIHCRFLSHFTVSTLRSSAPPDRCGHYPPPPLPARPLLTHFSARSLARFQTFCQIFPPKFAPLPRNFIPNPPSLRHFSTFFFCAPPEKSAGIKSFFREIQAPIPLFSEKCRNFAPTPSPIFALRNGVSKGKKRVLGAKTKKIHKKNAFFLKIFWKFDFPPYLCTIKQNNWWIHLRVRIHASHA